MITLSKPKIEDLLAKEIVLTNFKDWTNKGTIWTPDEIEYGFIYRIFEKCIGHITLNEGDVRFIKGNVFYYKTGKHPVIFYHGGENHYSFSKKPDIEYEMLSSFLDDSSLKRK
jgi:hypothetical protein